MIIYAENGVRNWLKLQQDVAFVKKNFKRGAVPSRETLKTLIEKKYQDNVARLKSSRSKRQRSCSAIENCKLACYGVKFPAKKIDPPMTMSLLQPHTEHEEEEQLRMATELLSLVTQEPCSLGTNQNTVGQSTNLNKPLEMK